MQTPRFIALAKHFDEIVGLDNGILVGSAALAARGLRDVNDLDVLVKEEIIDELRGSVGGAFGGANAVAVQTPHGVIQAATTMTAFAACRIDPYVIMEGSDTFDLEGLPRMRVISLQHLHDFKSQVGREKDLEDLALIEAFFANVGRGLDRSRP